MAIHITSINGMGSATVSGSTVVTTGMNANDHMHFSEDFLPSAGVVTRTDCTVSQKGTPDRSVDVSAGVVYVPNASWSKNSTSQTRFWKLVNDGVINVPMTQNVSGNPRIDIICAKVDDGATPDGDASNVGSFIVVEGTPAGSPSVPATPSDCYKLAEVAVANGYTSIVDANITDTRNRLTPDLKGGWVGANETWTYASADAPTYTFTISGDVTDKYSEGMRIRLFQTGTAYKYFIITKVAYSAPNTTVTVYGGTDYTLTNATIYDPCFSMLKAPIGFPLNPAKWTVTTTYSSDTAQASPSASTWYNVGSVTISIPIGVWDVRYDCLVDFSKGGATSFEQKTTLSTANNTESDSGFTDTSFIGGASGTIRGINTLSRMQALALTSKTSYYLNQSTSIASGTEISIRGDLTPVTIKAKCAYL